MELMKLTPELLQLCLSNLTPTDVLSFARTCKRAKDFVHPDDNRILWRSIFLNLYDDPELAWKQLMPTARARNRPREEAWHWYEELRKRRGVFYAVSEPTDDALLLYPEEVLTTLLDVVQTASCIGAPSRNVAYLNRMFEAASHAERVIHDFERDEKSLSLSIAFKPEMAGTPQTTPTVGQWPRVPEWASRLHIHYGITAREKLSHQAKGYARALVYTWLGTDVSAEYGPFLKDGSGEINWQTLEAIMSLMQRIFDIARQQLDLYQMPSGFTNTIPGCIPSKSSADWAGVERAWVGTYAFLDYRALVHYNFTHHVQRPANLGYNEEACGDLMTLNLRISELARDDSRLQTKLPTCQDLPTLYFVGDSTQGPNGRLPIYVKGFACLIPGGREVRWRFVISFAGHDQWQLEGVQPGGIRSGGIYGLWSHVDHEQHGPIGPFSYFPIEACEIVKS